MRAFALFADVQTFRYRQSSLGFGESGRSTETLLGTRLGCEGCTHTFPNASAFRTPFHRSGGCGSFHRKLPTGGAANGMPLKARTPDSSLTPDTSPSLVLTGSLIVAAVASGDEPASATKIASA